MGHGDTYRDLSSIYLKLLVKIKKSPTEDHASGTPAVGSDPAVLATGGGVVNCLLHSLFRQVSIYLNGKPVAQSDSNYPYRSIIEVICNYSHDAASTHLESIGYFKDTPGQLDNVAPSATFGNLGLFERMKLFEGSQTVELYGKLHGDMLNQSKLLINNVDLRIVLCMEKPEFYCLEGDAETSVASIVDTTLFMNHVTINPGILLAHEQILAQKNAVYPYKRVEVKSYTIPSKNMNISLDNCVIGVLPTFLLFCMVDNDAYTGKRSKSPFNFKHYDITSFNLVVNGVQIPNLPLTFDYSKNIPISTRGYANIFKIQEFIITILVI